MISAAMEIAGTLVVFGAVAFGLLYGLKYYRLAAKRLDRETADLDKS